MSIYVGNLNESSAPSKFKFTRDKEEEEWADGYTCYAATLPNGEVVRFQYGIDEDSDEDSDTFMISLHDDDIQYFSYEEGLKKNKLDQMAKAYMKKIEQSSPKDEKDIAKVAKLLEFEDE
jgi:hypothetical protein